MKKKIVYYIVYSILLALMLAAEAWLCISVIRMNMLPDLYIAIVIGLLAVLFGITAALLLICRKGKKVGIARQIIACILIAVTVAGCLFVSPKIMQLHNTVTQITTNEVHGPARNIYVKQEDPAETIEDAVGYTFAALQTDEYCVQQVVDAVKMETGKEIQVEYFDDESLMAVAYDNREVDALILNTELLSIWTENELYFEFDNKNRILHTVTVTENNRPTQPEQETAEPVQDITNTPFVVYLSGKDGYTKKLTNSRSDVNILMVVNPVTKQILMVNTPRDYYIVHPWGSGGRDKLTHCGIYGVDCSIDALENLYGVTVNYYMQINFTGFETMIDAIGGITVYSDHGFTCGDANEHYINAGENNLQGKAALAFARDRYHQPGGDNGRGLNQMKVIKAVISKVSNARTLVANYTQILKSLEGMIATDLTMDDLSKLVKMQLSDMAQWNVQTYAVTGYGGTETTYSMPGLASYVMHPHQSTVNYGSELIQRVIDGQILSEEDMTMPK